MTRSSRNKCIECPPHWMAERINVVLAGVGGTGSEVLDGLARIHHGLVGLGHPHGLRVTAYDHDVVEAPNIGRQRFSPADIGRNKAITLVHRYNQFFGLDWEAVPEFFQVRRGTFGNLQWPAGAEPDILITCVDQARVRADLGAAFAAARARRSYQAKPTFWLDIGNGRTSGQAVLGHALQGMEQRRRWRLPNVFDLYPELEGQDEDAAGPSCSLAAALREQDLWVNKFAAMSLGMLWTLITTGKLDRHGLFFDSATLTMRPLMVDAKAWAMMGYNASGKAA